jgi:hypothetical protein
MDDTDKIGIDAAAAIGIPIADIGLSRRKPGPKKKAVSRSEKISCRLMKEEKAKGEEYCRKHGITEAKLLRASYLAATAQEPEKKLAWIANSITQLFSSSTAIDEIELRSRIREVLKKGGLVLALVMFGLFLSAAPTIAKYILHLYETGKSIVYGPHESCIYHTGDIGCEMVPDK